MVGWEGLTFGFSASAARALIRSAHRRSSARLSLAVEPPFGVLVPKSLFKTKKHP